MTVVSVQSTVNGKVGLLGLLVLPHAERGDGITRDRAFQLRAVVLLIAKKARSKCMKTAMQDVAPVRDGDRLLLIAWYHHHSIVLLSAHGYWTNWQNWSPCSASCGTGIQKRVRLCAHPKCGGQDRCKGPYSQITNCHGRCCPGKQRPGRAF